MLFQKRTKVIGEFTYEIDLLVASESEVPEMRLLGLLGPMLSEAALSDEVMGLILGAAKQDRAIDSDLLQEVAPALRKAADGLWSALRSDPSLYSYFTKLFVAKTTLHANGESMPLSKVYDLHFQGRSLARLEWLTWCLKENFSDFLGGAGVMQRILAVVPRAGAKAG